MITHKNFGCVAFWPQAHEFKHYWMRGPPWSSSLIWLLPSHPAASPSAAAGLCSPAVLAAHSGRCTCCATRVLACSRATIPLPEFARMSNAVLLSVCTMQMDAKLVLLFNSGWIYFDWWLCAWGAVLPCLQGQPGTGSSEGGCSFPALCHRHGGPFQNVGFCLSSLEHMCQDLMVIISSDFFWIFEYLVHCIKILCKAWAGA